MDRKQMDERIARILEKIGSLKTIEAEHACDDWPPAWKPPMTQEEVSAFEAEHGIRLPEDYRRFITTIAAGGSQPFYGLNTPAEAVKEWKGCLKKDQLFGHSLDKPLVFLHMTQEEMDAWDPRQESGFLDLCTEGDGMESILIVNSRDPDTHGTVWFCDLSNDFGIAPIRHPETGEPFRFLDWLEYWADRTAEEQAYNQFSFIELVRLPEPPEDPDILGRQMGWLD